MTKINKEFEEKIDILNFIDASVFHIEPGSLHGGRGMIVKRSVNTQVRACRSRPSVLVWSLAVSYAIVLAVLNIIFEVESIIKLIAGAWVFGGALALFICFVWYALGEWSGVIRNQPVGVGRREIQ